MREALTLIVDVPYGAHGGLNLAETVDILAAIYAHAPMVKIVTDGIGVNATIVGECGRKKIPISKILVS